MILYIKIYKININYQYFIKNLQEKSDIILLKNFFNVF